MKREAGLYDPSHEHDACGVGFVADIRGQASHGIVQDAVRILCNLEHRGAVGGDMKTGDGAGILLQIPHAFLGRVAGFPLPEPGRYGVGFLFLPRAPRQEERARRLVEETVRREGFRLLGWREVPVNPDCLGELALREMPSFRQVFVALPEESPAQDSAAGLAGSQAGAAEAQRCRPGAAWDRRRCRPAPPRRKPAPPAPRRAKPSSARCTCCAAAWRTRRRGPDGGWSSSTSPPFPAGPWCTRGCSSRPSSCPSTPTWRRRTWRSCTSATAPTPSPPGTWRSPSASLAHNGEINTLRGNLNWMRAREGFA
jgi:hypothetical protein